jgi:FeS assembly SUF system regulator
MIRLAKLTDYGLVLMTTMARHSRAQVHTARDLASVTRLPLPTVSKVLKQLLQSGLLVSHRGNNGGYSLAKEPSDTSIADIVAAMEGPIALTECSTDITGLCDLERSCPIKTNQRTISEVVRGALEKVMLSDLAQPLQLTAIRGVDGKLVPVAGHPSGRVQ